MRTAPPITIGFDNTEVGTGPMNSRHGDIRLCSELAAGVQNIFAENLTMQNQDDATNPLNIAIGIDANLNRGGVTQNFHISQLYGCPTVSLHFRLPQSTERHPGPGQLSFPPQQGRIIGSSVTIAGLGQRPASASRPRPCQASAYANTRRTARPPD